MSRSVVGAMPMTIYADDIYRPVRPVLGKAAAWISKIHLTTLNDKLKDMTPQYIQRSRNEIVQHAKAIQYIIHAFVTEKQDLSEESIKETHRILATGVPISVREGPDIPPEDYGGVYRIIIVGASSCNFTVSKFVPAKMQEMCRQLKEELAATEEKMTIDPFSIAAKYSLEFVQIHPVQDGNGRICRMILNAILCRYAGIIVPIGEHVEERKEYIGKHQEAVQRGNERTWRSLTV
ncbi:hypothetical protein K449DRAFT_393958 [Hypoxylon sp. EC38]|nr:hypothetical protein K449DRAFT_393958 [Hypoxylon sp. EC38]